MIGAWTHNRCTYAWRTIPARHPDGRAGSGPAHALGAHAGAHPSRQPVHRAASLPPGGRRRADRSPAPFGLFRPAPSAQQHSPGQRARHPADARGGAIRRYS
ncbi:hypothetical protein G6F65_017793 [Rhizopus arrhizus]|nr:hypothetical protein G6F65_017793 [Rhizopus arrhizus]